MLQKKCPFFMFLRNDRRDHSGIYTNEYIFILYKDQFERKKKRKIVAF